MSDTPPIPRTGRLKTIVSPLTRRRFLTFCGVVGAAGIAAGVTQVHWSDLVNAAATTPLDPADGVLVIVTLYGGNDGLNTVIPASDAAYQAARGELAYPASDVLDLGEGLGLNPGMKGLHELWGNRSSRSYAAWAIRIPIAVTFDPWRSGRAPRLRRLSPLAGLVAGST